ncbi:hypothetical protein BDV11DRAFT_209530 [Aspergillus similis]
MRVRLTQVGDDIVDSCSASFIPNTATTKSPTRPPPLPAPTSGSTDADAIVGDVVADVAGVVLTGLVNSLQTVSLAIVGRLSPDSLATVAFSYMFATCTGWLIGLGGTTALDTLASSAFTGGSSQQDLGVLVQRALFVLGLLYLPVRLLWIKYEPVLRPLGQEPALSREPAKFLSLLIPGGIGYILFEIMKKYLQAQGMWKCPIYRLYIRPSHCVPSPLNAGLNYIFCIVLQLGLWGAPLATGLSYWATIPLASQSVIMSADQVINTIPFGISVATTSLVGKPLGARESRSTVRTAQITIWLSIVVGYPRVIELTAHVMPYVALFQIADGINGSCSGWLRTMGKQHVGAVINIISYYCSALPLGIWLSSSGYGLVGLWIGQCEHFMRLH